MISGTLQHNQQLLAMSTNQNHLSLGFNCQSFKLQKRFEPANLEYQQVPWVSVPTIYTYINLSSSRHLLILKSLRPSSYTLYWQKHSLPSKSAFKMIDVWMLKNWEFKSSNLPASRRPSRFTWFRALRTSLTRLGFLTALFTLLHIR